MLAEYDMALAQAKEQVVATHHGVAGEAAVRDWLAPFSRSGTESSPVM
jgi:hypothetical protein